MVVKEFHPSEEKKQFDYHIKEFPELFQRYVDKRLFYKYNSEGFRAEGEFVKDKSKKVDIFLGCSHTFGIGHYDEEIWPSIVAKETGNYKINLGIPSTGIGTCYYNLLKYIDFYNVQNIFMFAPIVPRFTFFFPDFSQGTFNPAWPIAWMDQGPYKDEYYKTVLTDDRMIYLNHMQFVHSIAWLAHSRGVTFYHKHEFPKRSYRSFVKYERGHKNGVRILEVSPDFPKDKVTLPRDGVHLCVEDMKQLGDDMIHLRKTYKEGYIEPIPYIDKIFAKKIP